MAIKCRTNKSQRKRPTQLTLRAWGKSQVLRAVETARRIGAYHMSENRLSHRAGATTEKASFLSPIG